VELAIGLWLGIASSLVAWIGIRAVRPRLEISKLLCLNPDNEICLKVLNRGRRSVLDLHVYCYTLRAADDHRYNDALTIGTVKIQPDFVPLLFGRSSKIFKATGLSRGRVIRLATTSDGDLRVPDFYVAYPHGTLMVHALAVDALTGSRLTTTAVFDKRRLAQGVYHKETVEIV
jgi:hypothetical protein